MSHLGSCACGRITFKTSGEVLSVTWCYCVTCQKQSGAPFLPFADFEKATVSWNQNPDIWSSSKLAERYFCKACGSAIGMLYFFDPNRIGITMGLIDGGKDLKLPPSAHIFLKDKPAWFQVPEDGAERCQEFNNNFTERVSAHERKM